MSKTSVILAALAVMTSVACDRSPAVEETPIGVEWRLEAITAASPRLTVPAADARYTLRLDADGRIAVRSDCNSCGGGYTLAPGTLEVTPLACTRAYCGDTSLDPRYPQYLSGARSWETIDGRLIITADEATLTFTR
jgi:heat shock protein HslJ